MKISVNLIEAHIIRRTKNSIEFLLLKRSGKVKYPNLWQMVTGSIEKGEKIHQTVMREIYEETDLIPEKLWIVPNVNSFYDKKKNEFNLIPVFAALIEKNKEIKISREHTEYKWVKKNEAKKLVAWDGQRKSIDMIYNFFIKREKENEFIEIKLNNIKK